MSAQAPSLPVWFILQHGSLIIDWAGPAEVFRIASRVALELGIKSVANFELRFAGPQSISESSVGAVIAQLDPLPQKLPAGAWVVIVGKTGAARSRLDSADDAAVIQWLRMLDVSARGVRLVTVCSGALLAGAAGLLNDRQVTTHHDYLERLRDIAPTAQVLENRVFVNDGALWSSAGVTAGIDLALHLVQERFGPVVTARTAQQMAVALRRGPSDPELSPFLAHRQHFSARLHRIQDAVSQDPTKEWSVQRMADVASITPRTLHRLFTEHTQTSARAYLRDIRLALARSALEAGASVTQAAEHAGFSSDLQLRRAWRSAGLPISPRAHGPLRAKKAK